jgi:ABC-2 type transport system permease protein
MKNSWLLALREFKERLNNRSFRWMLFLGPLLIIAGIYFLLASGNQGVSSMKVLIADPANLMEGKIVSNPSEHVTYYFYDDYIEMEAFKKSPKFQEFDALIEINEKVLINKKAFLFYKATPSLALKMKLKFDVERRIEEVMIAQFTTLSEEEFRRIKQPLNVDFRDVDDPYSQFTQEISWVGFTLGYIMMFFIAVFGTNITRSINREKANRISEVLLSSVRSHHLMVGKIGGNWLASMLQLVLWISIVGVGLGLLKEYIIPEYFTPEYLQGVQVSGDQMKELGFDTAMQQNDQLNLVYHRINYAWLLPNFFLFFVGTYWVFASFFTAMGAISGDSSDGQQFGIPIWMLLALSIFSGYNAMAFPESALTDFFTYFPWTAGMVAMVKLSVGVAPSEYLLLLVAWVIQLVTGLLLVVIAGRIFKNGILSYDHRNSWALIFQWLKKE